MSPSWVFVLPTLLGHHRALSWAPCAIQQLPTSSLFHTWQCTHVYTLSVRPILSYPSVSTSPYSRSASLFLHWYIYIYIYINVFWYMIFVFLSDLLHSVRQTQGLFTSYKWPNFIPFYGWVIFHCIYVPHLHPFICQWTSRLLPCPGYCKYCCNEHWATCVFFNYGFLRVYVGQVI